MSKENHLFRSLFLLSIFLLILNDSFLKYEFHNYFTGKLSDFAGLFAFPYFFACLFPKRIKSIYIFSGLLFIFWKSEFSQGFFDFANSYGIGINRIIDYSDLMALLILPISFCYWKYDFQSIIRPYKIAKPLIIVISSFSFIATSPPRHTEKLNMKSEFSHVVEYNLDYVREKLPIHAELKANQGDYAIYLPEQKAAIRISIRIEKLDSGRTILFLDSIKSFEVYSNSGFLFGRINENSIDYIRGLSRLEIETLFKENCKKELER